MIKNSRANVTKGDESARKIGITSDAKYWSYIFIRLIDRYKKLR